MKADRHGAPRVLGGAGQARVAATRERSDLRGQQTHGDNRCAVDLLAFLVAASLRPRS